MVLVCRDLPHKNEWLTCLTQVDCINTVVPIKDKSEDEFDLDAYVEPEPRNAVHIANANQF